MDRTTIAALIVAFASVLASLAMDHNTVSTFRHASILLLPLAIIAFPEPFEDGFRCTFRGMAHGGDGPIPGTMMRISAWILLVAAIVARHFLAAANVGPLTSQKPAIAKPHVESEIHHQP
jgi:hypothetical protein